MRDRLFFPLAFILASTFIFMALQPFAERMPSGPVSGGGRNAEDVTVKDVELHRFLPGARNSIEIMPATASEPAVLRITQQATDDYQDPRSGPHLVLAEDIEYALSHRRIQVDIEARSAGEFAASQFEANYLAKAEVRDRLEAVQSHTRIPDLQLRIRHASARHGIGIRLYRHTSRCAGQASRHGSTRCARARGDGETVDLSR